MIQVPSKYKMVVGILVISGILVSAGVFAFLWHKSEVEKAVTKERLRVSKETLLAVEQAYRQKEQVELSMQDKLQELQRKKDEQIRSISKRYDAIIAGLRDRKERASSSEQGGSDPSANAETACGCTGEGLYREDAEFLVGEAARAELIKQELLTCYKAYDSAREALIRYNQQGE